MKELLVSLDVVDDDVMIIVKVNCGNVSLARTHSYCSNAARTFFKSKHALGLPSLCIPDMYRGCFSDLPGDDKFPISGHIKTEYIVHVVLGVISHILCYHLSLSTSKYTHLVGHWV